MYNSGNSSKNVTGSAIVDGTVETVDIADDAVTADKLANSVNTDIATGVSGSTTAGDALPKAGGAMTGAITTNSTFDGVDVATRDGILTTTTATANDALPKAGGTMTGTIAGFESTGIDDNATATSLRIDATTGDVSVGVGNSKEPLIQKTNSGRVASNPGFSFRSDLDTGMFNPNLSNTLAFATGAVERMRINSDGRVLIGCTELPSATVPGIGFTGDQLFTAVAGTAANTQGRFYNGNGLVGSIVTSGTATAYNTSSDYRLKDNVLPMTGSIDRLKALKPSKFNFIADPTLTVDGFLAHEAQSVVPEAVHGTKDAMMDEEYEVTPEVEAVLDAEGNVTTEAVEAVMGTRNVPDYQAIDQSKLVPLLVAALQEAITRIETLENA